MSPEDKEYLRCLFAMFAMNGLISRGSVWEPKEVYEIADEMMEELEPKEEGIVKARKKRVQTI